MSGVDVNPGVVSSFARTNSIKVTSNFINVINDPNLDAIVIATPHSLHERQICAAAEAGKHVFCEKPLGLTLASAKRSVAACNKAGVVLGVGHERRFEPAMQEVGMLISTGKLGDIMHVEANFSHDKLANLESNNWRVSSTESPAAAMTATGVHITDAYVNMFGPVEQVFAMTAMRNRSNANGDILNFNLRFKSGVTGSFNSVLETPLYIRYAVFGSKAWVETRDYTHPSEPGITEFFISSSEGNIEKKTYQYVDTVRLNFESWADAISGVADYPFSSEQKLENIAVFEAVCQSAKTGLPVSL